MIWIEYMIDSDGTVLSAEKRNDIYNKWYPMENIVPKSEFKDRRRY